MSKRITSRTGAFFGAGGAYQRPQTGAKSSDKNKSYMQIDVSKDLEKRTIGGNQHTLHIDSIRKGQELTIRIDGGSREKGGGVKNGRGKSATREQGRERKVDLNDGDKG